MPTSPGWATKDPSGPSNWGNKGWEGVYKLEQPCGAEYDVIGLQIQPSNDVAPELGHSIYLVFHSNLSPEQSELRAEIPHK